MYIYTIPAALSRLGLAYNEAAIGICDGALAAAGGRDSLTADGDWRVPNLNVEAHWPLQDIAIANIVLCMAYKGEVAEASNITQNVCNSIAIACERCRWAGQYQDD